MNHNWTKGKRATPPSEVRTILCDGNEVQLVIAKARRAGMNATVSREPDGRTAEVLPNGQVKVYGEKGTRKWRVTISPSGDDAKPVEGESFYRFTRFSEGIRGDIGLAW